MKPPQAGVDVVKLCISFKADVLLEDGGVKHSWPLFLASASMPYEVILAMVQHSAEAGLYTVREMVDKAHRINGATIWNNANNSNLAVRDKLQRAPLYATGGQAYRGPLSRFVVSPWKHPFKELSAARKERFSGYAERMSSDDVHARTTGPSERGAASSQDRGAASSQDDTQPWKKSCLYWDNGCCHYGRSCKFYHSGCAWSDSWHKNSNA